MQIRARILSRDPLCAECLPRIKASEEVDHIVPLHKGGTDDDDNLRGLCREHHAQKTARDAGHERRSTIGRDGWPIG